MVLESKWADVPAEKTPVKRQNNKNYHQQGRARARTPETSQVPHEGNRDESKFGKRKVKLDVASPLTPPASSPQSSGKLSPDKLSALRDKIAEQRQILENNKQKQLLEDFLNGELDADADDDEETWG